MSEDHTRDAIDINDFVYAATGARVRRLTLPNGEHWFPAVDVATDLGYATLVKRSRGTSWRSMSGALRRLHKASME